MAPIVTTLKNVQTQSKHINYVTLANLVGQQNPNLIDNYNP
jgi:hypothetical protein